MFKTTFAALAVCLLALTGCPGEDEAACIEYCADAAADTCSTDLSEFTCGNVSCSEQPYQDAYNAAWEAAGCTLGNGDDDDSAN